MGEKTPFRMNLYELEDVDDIYINIQSYSEQGAAEGYIYNIWLEK